MAVTVYKSGDTAAPVLSGTVGSLITVLDAVLVNGYGDKAAAGWTKPYTGTNIAVFRAGGGNQTYVRVFDAAPGAAGAKQSAARGYLAMTDANTGTDPYPTTVQLSDGIFFFKSDAASSAARAWVIIADNKRFYLVTEPYGTNTNYHLYFFGDIRSYAATDLYSSVLSGQYQDNQADGYYSGVTKLASTCTYSASESGSFIARNYTGTGTSAKIQKMSNYCFGNQATLGAGTANALTYPNPADTGVFMGPVYVQNEANKLRGVMPGLWCPWHNKPMAHGDTFGGVGGMTGKTFIVLNCGGTEGQCFIETSNTWDS